ncbi:putative ribonuclease H-like domain, reverse transcriptase zinc-binding domain-containing protein [Senna tora]|uniref:Putative ribonuclease H-like domain, reverse transcriptase zinc-binding domain-containing protein n=1 Tax=Senna tora TaxID=362788 RepID=A0A834TN67_9FABA|nr:putative ribonuclease H-like domain, reverse transcriptase zinc-binding domain-containing protein [Senna tora]
MKPKNWGGLAIRKSAKINACLMAKQKSQIKNNHDSLATNITIAKYDISITSHNLSWNTLFPYLIRDVWLSRNRFLFQQVPFDSNLLANQAIQRATEYHFTAPQPSIPINKSQVHISWHKPPLSFYKLNINGSASNGLLGSRGIIRDENGRPLTSFHKFTSSGNALLAELWALHIGLTVAIQSGIENIIIETDAMLVTHLMNHPMKISINASL